MPALTLRLVAAAAIVAASILSSAVPAFATHARGGTVTWERVSQTATVTEFRVTYKANFRWSFPWATSTINHCLAIPGFVATGSTVGNGSCAPVGTVIPAGNVGQINFLVPNPPSTTGVGLSMNPGGVAPFVSSFNPTFRIDKVIAEQDQAYASYSFTVWVPKSGTTLTGARIRWTLAARLTQLLNSNNDINQIIEVGLVHNLVRSPEAIMTAIVPVTTGVLNQITIPVSVPTGLTASLTVAPQAQSGLNNIVPLPASSFGFSTTTPNTILFTPSANGLYAVQLNVNAIIGSTIQASAPFEFIFQATPACVGTCKDIVLAATDATPSVEVGESLSFSINATATNLTPGSPPTSLTIDNTPLPAGMSVTGSPVSNTLPSKSVFYTYSITPTAADIGTYPVCFQGITAQFSPGVNNMVSDPLCVVISIVEHNDPPVLQCAAPQTVPGASPAGTLANVLATFSDPDVDALTLSWRVNGNPAGFTNFSPSAIEQTGTLNFLFPIGPNLVEATLTDGVDSVSCTTTVTVTKLAQTVTFNPPATVAFGTPSIFLTAFGASGNTPVFTVLSGPATVTGNTLFFSGLGMVDVEAAVAGNAIYEAGTAVRAISVEDQTAPDVTVTTPPATEATSPDGAVVTFAASALDNVDGSIIPTCVPASGSTFEVGDTSVTCTATDAAGNTGTASILVSVVDTTPPMVDGHDDVTAEATSAAGAVVTFDAPDSSDIVSGPGTASCVPASGSTFGLGPTTVTCTAYDAAANSGATTFDVNVVDTTAPVISFIENMTVEAVNAGGATATFASPIADDVVDGSIAVTCSPASGSNFPLGVSTVICTSEDAAGNDASMSFTVTVRDTTAPAISSHGPEAAEATSASGAAVTFSNPSAIDEVDATVTVTCVPASGSTFPIGTTDVICSATDAAGNPATPSNFPVTVADSTGPTIAAHADLTPAATSATGAIVNYDPPATSDLVDGSGVATCLPASGFQFPMGETIVTCNASDSRGNPAVATTFTVTITNNTPTFTPPVVPTAEAAGPAGAVVTFTAAGNDVEDGPIPAVCSPASGATFPIGDTTVNCTVTDVATASASGSFTVSVRDTTAPVVSYTGNAGTYGLTDTVNITCGATDAVGVTSSTCANISGPAHSFSSTGPNTYSATAQDAAGNVGSGSTTFTVAPTLADLQILVSSFCTSGPANGMNAKLAAAASAPNANAKAGQLGAFENQVQAQTGKCLTPAQAALLLQWVQTLY